jgi:hypothetical protein
MWTKTLSSCLIAGSLAAFGGPLDKARIASDAKWIVHVDCEALRNSAFGDYVMTEFVKPQLENNDQLKHANLSMNISNIMSITAYGPAFDKGPEGVLIVTTTADPKKDLDTVAGMFLASAGTNAPFMMVEKDPLPLYTFSKAVYFAPAGHTLFVAKSREQILRAHEVLEGKSESLAKSSGFKDLREPPKSFFCAAVADGFIGTMGIPPQAQILREATGGRISLGERDKNVFVNLVFQGKDDMATTRIQQVLQGLVALASLSQQDEEITRLAGGIKIAAEGGGVQVDLEYPVDKTIQKIRETSAQDHKPHAASKGSKGKDKAKHKKKKDVAADEAGAADDDNAAAKDKDSPPKEKTEQPQ